MSSTTTTWTTDTNTKSGSVTTYTNTVSSLKQYKNEIENKEFPTESHSYKAGEDIEKMLKSWKKELKKIKLS